VNDAKEFIIRAKYFLLWTRNVLDNCYHYYSSCCNAKVGYIMKFPIIIHKDTDSDYGVTVPDLPGCFSAGDSYMDALESAQEAYISTHR